MFTFTCMRRALIAAGLCGAAAFGQETAPLPRPPLQPMPKEFKVPRPNLGVPDGIPVAQESEPRRGFPTNPLPQPLSAVGAKAAKDGTPKSWTADNADLHSDTVGTKTIVAVMPKNGGAGFAWLEGTAFREGTIEVELKGHGVFGIAFGDVGGKGPEEILFETDGANRIRNVSYAAPADGSGLRKDATSVVRANAGRSDWCSVKIAVEPKKVRVFIDGSTESFFTAPRAEKTNPARTGISVRPRGDASFANFKVTPLDDALPKKGLDKKEKG